MEKMQRLSENFLKGNKSINVRNIKYRKNAELHSHEFYEVEIVLSGTGEQLINGKKYRYRRGSVWIMTPADFHEYSCEGEIEVFGIYFSEKLLPRSVFDKIFSKNYSRFINLTEEKIEDVRNLMENIGSAMHYDDYSRETLMKKLIECVFITIMSEVGEMDETAEKAPFLLARRYIEIHFRENPSLEEVARVIGKSPVYFSKYFYLNAGMYYTDYLNRQKINCAKFLLSESNMTATEICYEAGFSSFSNFIRVFKKEEEITPTEYRKKQKT